MRAGPESIPAGPNVMTLSSVSGEIEKSAQDAPARKETLIGLSRSELAARLLELGVPERQSRMRVRQLWSWLYVRGATDFAGMTDIAKELRGELGASLHAGAAGDRDRAGLGRRHAQMAAASCRRQGDRDRLYPRGGSRHALHLEPGRLHADLLVLPYRHAEARAQSHPERDRRPDHARPRPARRLARRGRARPARAAGR